MRRATYFIAVLMLAGTVISIYSNNADSIENTISASAISSGQKLNFTYLDHDAVNFGSTAFRVWDDDLTIFIEAFPNVTACDWDPETISEADIIFQNYHGHSSHYDANECATVALNTGAFVVGNSQLKSDMTSRGVSSSKIIEMSPTMGNKVTKSIPSLGVSITAFGMDHTMLSGTKVDTYLVEMPSGIKWYHGTCSSETNTYNYMDNHNELDYIDVMILDTDVFVDTNPNTRWHPETLIKDHDFNSALPIPATVYESYPTTHSTLRHNNTYQYVRPEYYPELINNVVEPVTGDPFTDFTFSVMYKYRPDQEPTNAKIVIDDTSQDMIKGSSSDYRVGVTYSLLTQLPAGSSKYHFEFEVDGKSVRLPESGELDGPQVNAIPVLKNEMIYPDEGDDETEFTFSVIYQDVDGDFAIMRNIFVDGDKETMSTDDTDPVTGMNYTHTTSLSIGPHSYYYEFSDGKNMVRYPEEGDFSVSDVIRANYAPVLTKGEHDPPLGHRQTLFTFAVKYRDSHGDEPIRSIIVLDGEEFEMTPMGTDYTRGVTYVYKTNLNLGNHSYHFEFSDMDFDVRHPIKAEDDYKGPIVENRDPEAVISHPIDYGEFADDEPILLDASNSTDSDGDQLNYTWSSDIDGELGYGKSIFVILSEGQHNIKLEIEDGLGGSSYQQLNVYVTHFEAIIIIDLELEPKSPKEGQEIVVTASISNAGNIGSGPILLTFYLDGENIRTQSYTQIISGGKHDFEAVISPGPGDHTLLVQLDDGPSEYLNFTISERAVPIANCGENLSIELGDAVYMDASGSIFEGTLVLIQWDLGDDTTKTGISIEHTYSSAGVYNVTLTITDELDKTSSTVVTITVVDPIQQVTEPDDKEKNSGTIIMITIIVILLVLISALIMGALLLIRKRKVQSPQTPLSPPPPTITSAGVQSLPQQGELKLPHSDLGSVMQPGPSVGYQNIQSTNIEQTENQTIDRGPLGLE